MKSSIALCLIILTLATIAVADEIGLKQVVSVPAPRLVIDGIIEASWKAASLAEGFIQKEPDDGVEVSFTTRVYVMFDRETLYVAFDCADPAPDSISAPVKRRELNDDADWVAMYIDTFHDRRNGYYFAVTAGGVQVDGTISNTEDFDSSWDGIWKSTVAMHDNGWSAELSIPFQSFRHGGARNDGWGIQFKREIYRLSEQAYWQPVPRNQNNKTDNFGVLEGLEGIRHSTNLELLPHAVGTWTAPDAGKYTSDLAFHQTVLYHCY